MLENVVVHGLSLGSGSEGEGILTVCGEPTDEGDILFTVTDNGSGISQEKLEEINTMLQSISSDDFRSMTQEKHIGLVNVQQRIKLAFGDSYGIRLESSNTGTTAFLKIKALTVEELAKVTKNINIGERR